VGINTNQPILTEPVSLPYPRDPYNHAESDEKRIWYMDWMVVYLFYAMGWVELSADTG
jgi:hypothetical protein